jgi:hypothetical protein
LLNRASSRRRGQWPALCADIDLSYSRLCKFADGRIREPGVTKIETLQGYFANHPVAESTGEQAQAA